MATSVPVPIAIADVGAGEGRRVVDAVADHGDRPSPGLEAFDDGDLVLGQDIGDDPVGPDAHLRRATASAVARASPVSEPDLEAPIGQLADGGRGLRLDRVADRDEPGGATVDRHDRDRPTGSGGGIDGVVERLEVDVPAGDEASVADERPSAGRRRPDRPFDAATRDRGEVRDPPETRLVEIGPMDDGCTERMLAGRVSTAAARSSTSSTSKPAAATIAVDGSVDPSVSVPVLSRTTASTRCAISSASPPRTRMPASAPSPGPDHDRGRGGQAHRARAGDDRRR